MKIDTQELRQVAAAQSPRMDMYGGIHKALRALMADTLLAVGRMDSGDELELAQTTQRVVELLDFCASHLAHENEFVHTALEARAPGASAAVAHEHEEHERHIQELRQAVEVLRATPAVQRDAAAQDLYRALALFIAGNFQHMHVEETAHNAVLWARYTDAELVADPPGAGGVDPARGDDVRGALDGAVHEPGRARGGAGGHAGPCTGAGVRRGARHRPPSSVEPGVDEVGAQPVAARGAGNGSRLNLARRGVS